MLLATYAYILNYASFEGMYTKMAVFGSLQFTTAAADDSKITNESLSCLVGWACVALVEEGVKWAF